MIPKEFIAFIGASRPYKHGDWVATADGTHYIVVGEPILTDRLSCRYDIPVDIRTAISGEEWREKYGRGRGDVWDNCL
jgi:hypothetical protein